MFGLIAAILGIWFVLYIVVGILKGISTSIKSWKKERLHNHKMKTDPTYKKKYEYDCSAEGMKEKARRDTMVYNMFSDGEPIRSAWD